MGKYGNKKIQVGDKVFDSLREARRYSELCLLQRGGYIKDLELQKKFVLIPSQYDKHKRLLERECSYYADFCYVDTDTNETIVEDTKGFRTDVYKIKKKLMLYVHNIRIKEV